MITQTDSTIFAILLTGALFTFGLSVRRLFRAVRLGRPDGRLRGTLERRIVTMLEYAFGQRRVLQEPFGRNHFFLFWGFVILFFDNAGFVLSGLFPGLHLNLLGPVFYPVLTCLYDVMPILVIVCVGVALYRRLVVKPAHIEYRSVDAFVILGAVATLMFLFYGYHGAEIALGEAPPLTLMPFTRLLVAPAMSATFGTGLEAAGRAFWWLHALVFLAFLNYLPYSKHLHILTAIPNCFCRSLEPVRTIPRESFQARGSYGASRVDHLSWKDLLDFTACTECGRCTQACPATHTRKHLNPRAVIHEGRRNLFANAEKLRNGNRTEGLVPLIAPKDGIIPGAVGEDAIWECTTCGACMAVCPVFIEHVPKLVQLRRHLVEEAVRFPSELTDFFESVEQRSNPWGLPPADRGTWAKGLDLPLLSELPEGERVDYLFYVGCAGALDSRARQAAVALARLLRAADLKFGILGPEEPCCGDSLRRLGNEFVFDRLAKANVELFERRGVRSVVCYCPHCYTTLKNDYAQFGFKANVVHYSELLPELLRRGHLKLQRPPEAGRVVLHDSCYLGRYNGLFDEPRRLVEAAAGSPPVDLDRRRERAFCCGAGGGRMWMEEDPAHRVNLDRVREALEKKPDTVAVACPYCMTMFEDGVKDLGAEQGVKVLDIAELLAARLPVV
ncbi:MAG: (Fe-S)-binding protein [Deltaproteobacteria bacterium]|nr:(Fe-S)-binding protein [Deltaproteobacteria bacterium]